MYFYKGDIMKRNSSLQQYAAHCFSVHVQREVENEPLEISLASENYAVEYTGLLRMGFLRGAAAFTGEEPDGSKWNGEGNFESGN